MVFCVPFYYFCSFQQTELDCHSFPGQLTVTRHLCHLYGCESPDQAQCIIYSQHQVQLLGHTGDRGQEGDALEAISQLYLTLGTERCVCSCTCCIVRTYVFNQKRERTFLESEDILTSPHFFKGLFQG